MPPLVGRGAASFFVTWTPPPHPLTKMTLLVTKDGGGEVFRKELALRRGSPRQVQVKGLESSTRYSVQLLGQYEAVLSVPLPQMAGGRRDSERPSRPQRVVAFADSDAEVIATLEP